MAPLKPVDEGGREETAMAGGDAAEVSVAEIRTGGSGCGACRGG